MTQKTANQPMFHFSELKSAVELVDELTEKAVNALHGFDGDTKELEEFAYKLAKRNK